jgi:D-lactate dehydrogenase
VKVAVFDTHNFEKHILENSNKEFKHELNLLEVKLTKKTASLANGNECVCVFVNDKLDKEVITILKSGGTKLLALRSAGFNHVDLLAAKEYEIKVVRVPEYSPYAVAEYACGLILNLNRKIHKAYNRVREGNFSLEGLVGFNLHDKIIGVIGTGRIGKSFIKIMKGFGCYVLAFDLKPDYKFADEIGFSYVSFDELIQKSDIISLHLPLNPGTNHLINSQVFDKMKSGSVLINTGRGRLVDTKALIASLKSGHLGAAGLDVYEEEENFFFQDLSDQILQDDVLSRLITFPNVLLTSHQGFLTREALENISHTTLQNISDFEKGVFLQNEIKPNE